MHRTPTRDESVALLFMLTVAVIMQVTEATQLTTGTVPCSCKYVHHTTSYPTPGQSAHARRVRHTTRVVATGFTLDPACPHHGRSAT